MNLTLNVSIPLIMVCSVIDGRTDGNPLKLRITNKPAHLTKEEDKRYAGEIYRTYDYYVLLSSTLKGHDGHVTSLDISPDGKTIVSASKDKTLILWDKASGVKKAILKGHKDSVESVQYHPKGHKILSGSKDKILIIWDADTYAISRRFNNQLPVIDVSYCSPGNIFASASNMIHPTDHPTIQVVDGVIVVWRPKLISKNDALYYLSNAISDIEFSPDGKSYAFTSDTTSSLTYELLKSNIANSEGEGGDRYSPDRASGKNPLLCLAYSPDGKTIATGDQKGNILLWEIKPLKIASTLKGHKDAVTSVSFCPDGKLLLSGSKDKTVRLWDLSTKKNIITKTDHTGEVLTVKFSPNGKFFASGSADKTVKVWSIKRIDKKKKK